MAERKVWFDELLTTAEVAAMFRVDPKTVARWANSGKLTPLFTPGGYRRFRADEVDRLREEHTGASETDS